MDYLRCRKVIKFVSEAFAKKWYELGIKYKDYEIKNAALKAGLEEYLEYNRWEARAAFKAAKEGFPFEIKTWMRFGDIPIGEDRYAGQSKHWGTNILELGVSVISKEWFEKIYNEGFVLPKTVGEIIYNGVAIAEVLARPKVHFTGLQVGYGHDHSEPVVLPVGFKKGK